MFVYCYRPGSVHLDITIKLAPHEDWSDKEFSRIVADSLRDFLRQQFGDVTMKWTGKQQSLAMYGQIKFKQYLTSDNNLEYLSSHTNFKKQNIFSICIGVLVDFSFHIDVL